MLRLTIVTVAALGAAMLIWGEPRQSDVQVTRSNPLEGPLLAVPAVAASAKAPEDISPEEAVQMALAAGEKPQQPEPAPEQAAEVEAPSAEEPAEEAAPVWYVTGSAVNLREGPSTSTQVVGRAGKGDEAELLSDPADTWIRIRTSDGTEAYIYGRFLSETPA